MRVEAARQIDGTLQVDLIREVPEELKPRGIEIMSGKTKALPKKAVNQISFEDGALVPPICRIQHCGYWPDGTPYAKAV